MAFDFPASPTNGTVSNGYTWNAATGAWMGGPGIAGPMTEQFFQLPAGSAPLDIQVPTWVTAVQLIGAVWGAGPLGAGVRISTDGTTFLAGATDYSQAGPVLNAGTSAYQAFGTASLDCLWLTASSDNTNYPHHFTAELELKRPDTARVIAMKTWGRSLDLAAASSHRSLVSSGYISATALGSSLAVKAIRIFPRSTSWGAGSWVRVKWLGDSAAIPQTNAIADAPNDGYQYTRAANAWNNIGVVTATGLPPTPQVAAAAGQFLAISAAGGAALVLPAGGTWAWAGWAINSSGNITVLTMAGVNAGGTPIIAALTGRTPSGFCWRIA